MHSFTYKEKPYSPSLVNQSSHGRDLSIIGSFDRSENQAIMLIFLSWLKIVGLEINNQNNLRKCCARISL